MFKKSGEKFSSLVYEEFVKGLRRDSETMEDPYGRKDRIGKRMAYLLRYGALKEGLHADTEGACFVFCFK